MIDHNEFIKVWNESDSVHEVARHFDQTASYVRVRARFLRDLGYQLKSFRTKQKAN